MKNSKLSIPPYTTYGGIKTQSCQKTQKVMNTLNTMTSFMTCDERHCRQTQQTFPVHFLVFQSATKMLHNFRTVKRLQQLSQISRRKYFTAYSTRMMPLDP